MAVDIGTVVSSPVDGIKDENMRYMSYSQG
jgi:hypothetical protein